jgi:hypothetical protein
VKSILIDEAAEQELLESVSFYEEREPGLGLDFEQPIRSSFKKDSMRSRTHPFAF